VHGGRLLRLRMSITAAKHGAVKVVPTKVAHHDRSHSAIAGWCRWMEDRRGPESMLEERGATAVGAAVSRTSVVEEGRVRSTR
jgi:hypothetical protein